jgi:RNA polymerase sigma-70 factor (ECF subfamily)
MSLPPTFDHMTDTDIVQESRVTPNAFAVLVHRYEAKLDRYVMRLGVRRLEDRQDLLQDIFIKVYRNLNSFDTTLSFSTWLYRIAHNETVSFFRKQAARPEGHQVAVSDELFSWLPDAAQPSAERLFDTEVSGDVLREALAALEPKYRDPIILRYFEHCEYDEISDILKIPIGSVGTRIHRGKKLLKALIPDTYNLTSP